MGRKNLKAAEFVQGWDFSGYSQISGLRIFSESNKNVVEMHFQCDILPSRIQTLNQSHPCLSFKVFIFLSIVNLKGTLTESEKEVEVLLF